MLLSRSQIAAEMVFPSAVSKVAFATVEATVIAASSSPKRKVKATEHVILSESTHSNPLVSESSMSSPIFVTVFVMLLHNERFLDVEELETAVDA